MERNRIEPFVLLLDGYHEATGKRYEGRIAEQLQADTDLGDRYRRWALGMRPLSRPPVCIHRGKLLDVTTCKCKIYHCKKHGTCSNNKRSGLRLCRECSDFTAPQ